MGRFRGGGNWLVEILFQKESLIYYPNGKDEICGIYSLLLMKNCERISESEQEALDE